jgi:hypothetical protein
MQPYHASLIDKWDNRAAAFFASFSFVLATLGTNVRTKISSAPSLYSPGCYLNIPDIGEHHFSG